MTQSYRLPAASRKRSTPYCNIMGGEYAMLPVSADKLTKEAEDFITETLLKALFKFRFSRVSPPDTTE